MKIFISWSGEKSRKTAEILCSFLKKTIQAVEPWISTNIPKGSRSFNEISDTLEEAKVGIICLNSENLRSEWILFESGALSKTKDAYVCNFLLDISPIDIGPPLSQFQHTEFEKEDLFKLLKTINSLMIKSGGKPVEENTITELFETFWDELQNDLNEIKSEESKPIRTIREMIEELLETQRWQSIFTLLEPKNPIEVNEAIINLKHEHQSLKDQLRAKSMEVESLKKQLNRFVNKK